MAITLAESAYLSQNKLQKGIIEELLYTSPLMGKLPFVTVSGNALAINREDSDNLGSADFYAVDGTWVETSAAFSQATYSLTTLGGDVDVNNLIRQSRSNINDQMAAQVKVKTKKMTHTFEDQMIYSTSGQGFSGLHSLTDSAMHVHQGSGSTGAALSLKNLDKAVDMVSVLGTPSFILLNKTLNRQISSYLRTVGSYTTERDDYGHYFTMWQGIPIITTDWIGQVEAISGSEYSAKTGGYSSSIFVVLTGEGEGLVGIQNGGIQTQVWDSLETKDASRTRIKWYVGTALFSTKAIARIDGITDATVTV
jgi:hypothetical protein